MTAGETRLRFTSGLPEATLQDLASRSVPSSLGLSRRALHGRFFQQIEKASSKGAPAALPR